jgi:hypothetical protein
MGCEAMIIQDKFIRADGTVELRNIDVEDTYLDLPEIVTPKPTPEQQIAELQITVNMLTSAILETNLITTEQYEQITGQAYTA